MTEYVYFIEIGVPLREKPVKVGRARDTQKRLMGLQCSSPWSLTLLRQVEAGLGMEAALHSFLAAERMQGEWFRRGLLLDHVLAMSDEEMLSRFLPQRARHNPDYLASLGLTPDSDPLTILRIVNPKKREAERRVAAAMTDIRQIAREAKAHGVPVRELTGVLGISRARLYKLIEDC